MSIPSADNSNLNLSPKIEDFFEIKSPTSPSKTEELSPISPSDKKASQIEITLGTPAAPPPDLSQGVSCKIPGVSGLAILIDFSETEYPRVPKGFYRGPYKRAFTGKLAQLFKQGVPVITTPNLVLNALRDNLISIDEIHKHFDIYKNSESKVYTFLPRGIGQESLSLSRLNRVHKFDIEQLSEDFKKSILLTKEVKYLHLKHMFERNEDVTPRISIYLGGHGSADSHSTCGLADTQYNDFLTFIDKVYERPKSDYPTTIFVSSCQPHGHEPTQLNSLLMRGGIPGLNVSSDAFKVNFKAFFEAMESLTKESTAQEEDATIERALFFLDTNSPTNMPLIFRTGAKPIKSKKKYLLTFNEERRLWLEGNLKIKRWEKEHLMPNSKVTGAVKELAEDIQKAGDKASSSIEGTISKLEPSKENVQHNFLQKKVEEIPKSFHEHVIKPPVNQIHLFPTCIRTPLKLIGSPPPAFFSHLESGGYHMFSSIEAPQCDTFAEFVHFCLAHKKFEKKALEIITKQAYFIKSLKLSHQTYENILVTFNPGNSPPYSVSIYGYMDNIHLPPEDFELIKLKTDREFLFLCHFVLKNYKPQDLSLKQTSKDTGQEMLQFFQSTFFPKYPWVADLENSAKALDYLKETIRGSEEQELLFDVIISLDLLNKEILEWIENNANFPIPDYTEDVFTEVCKKKCETGEMSSVDLLGMNEIKLFLEKNKDKRSWLTENGLLDVAIENNYVQGVNLFVKYGAKIKDINEVSQHLYESSRVEAKQILGILAEKQLLPLDLIARAVMRGHDIKLLIPTLENYRLQNQRISPKLFMDSIESSMGAAMLKQFSSYGVLPDVKDFLAFVGGKDSRDLVMRPDGSLRISRDIFANLLKYTNYLDPEKIFLYIQGHIVAAEKNDNIFLETIPILLNTGKIPKETVQPFQRELYKVAIWNDHLELYKSLLNEGYVKLNILKDLEEIVPFKSPLILTFLLKEWQKEIANLPYRERIESSDKLLQFAQKYPVLISTLCQLNIECDFLSLFTTIQRTLPLISRDEREDLLASYNRYLTKKIPHEVQIKLTPQETEELTSIALKKDLGNIYVLLMRSGYLGKWADDTKVKVFMNTIYSYATGLKPWGRKTLVSDFMGALSQAVASKAYCCALALERQWDFFCKRLELKPQERLALTTELFLGGTSKPEILPFLLKIHEPVDFTKVRLAYEKSSDEIRQQVNSYLNLASKRHKAA